MGLMLQDLKQVINLRQLKVLVFSINTFTTEEIGKVALGKRVPKRIAYKAICMRRYRIIHGAKV
jgi:hypothetical protein